MRAEDGKQEIYLEWPYLGARLPSSLPSLVNWKEEFISEFILSWHCYLE